MVSKRRLRRIFSGDGRTLIVAMDHGLIDGPCPGLEEPGHTISQVVSGGADAILTSYGVAHHFADHLSDVGVILRLDGGGTSLGSLTGPGSLFYRLEDALRLGADAVAVSAFPGADDETGSLARLAQVIGAAHGWGLPVMAEMVPGGFDSPPEKRSTDAVALAVRVGAELGADLIKTPYTADFERVIAASYVPVVMLGGARRGDEAAMLHDIRSAVGAGGAGVAIGRNIFQADDPAAMTATVAKIVHGTM